MHVNKIRNPLSAELELEILHRDDSLYYNTQRWSLLFGISMIAWSLSFKGILPDVVVVACCVPSLVCTKLSLFVGLILSHGVNIRIFNMALFSDRHGPLFSLVAVPGGVAIGVEILVMWINYDVITNCANPILYNVLIHGGCAIVAFVVATRKFSIVLPRRSDGTCEYHYCETKPGIVARDVDDIRETTFVGKTTGRPFVDQPSTVDSEICIICTANKKTMMISECNHLCFCYDCAKLFIERPPWKCPICRTKVAKKLIRVI